MGRLWILVVTSILALVALYVVPVADIMLLSVSRTDLTGARYEVGLSNFLEVASGESRQPLIATFVFAAAAVSVQIFLALLAALLTHQQFPGVQTIRAALVMPYLASTVVVVVAWDFFSDPITGFLPAVIRQLGMQPLDLRGPGAVLPAIITVATYEAFPFAYLVILGRLFQIPAAHYEIASVFGGGAMATFRHVTWPQIRSALGALFVLRTLITLMKIDVPWLVYAGDAPSRWGDTFSVHIYRLAFEFLQPGRAAAASVFFLTGVALLYSLWLTTSAKGRRA